ncbi:ABC transporter substrate-binding protein [Planotetraspora kaengkrachanensis]|uniref:Sugar ABC transporter substrate-binding protein n=1 Tax=Planotetraspora kaengkrachanensis TaxID=575193 RepID=A0A8J3M7M5_9ACTN|nr:sugar ABC transporter substrate-binding protein [Planotetraspora kaengkrachanensis]GIG78915.1 sugar ABC transporter substrate-binding protein [Planotetraspora kaengkrachanensis]
MKTSRRTLFATMLTLSTLAVAACGGGGSETPAADGKVTLTYALWDDRQQPAYQQCADAFQAKNPGISIKITQSGWDQYWTDLTAKLVAGDAPDVFTDHLSRYPELAANNQVLDIQPYVDKDKLDLSIYQKGLADLWVRDGKRYGLPKDWDTIAVVYNTEQVAKAGIDPAEFATWTWNPTDGGDFEKAVAKLTVDGKGRNGLDPDFDKNDVKTYGLALETGGGAYGQGQWSHFAASDGFVFTDKNPFGSRYNYDDPKLAETIDWYAGLIKKGYMPPYDQAGKLGVTPMMEAGKAAMVTTGSWTISSWGKDFAFAPLPVGPQGRKTMINGLADSIYAGTQHKDEAWKWVSFLGSAECQDLIAQNAVVFPAITTSADKAMAAHKAAGRDVSAFVEEANDPQGTFLYPITDNAAKVEQLVLAAYESVMLGKATASTALPAVNTEVNNLFQ